MKVKLKDLKVKQINEIRHTLPLPTSVVLHMAHNGCDLTRSDFVRVKKEYPILFELEVEIKEEKE